MQCVNLLIGGRSIPARNGATFDRIDPYTGAVASRAAAATVDDADAAVAAAQGAFPSWSAIFAHGAPQAPATSGRHCRFACWGVHRGRRG